MKRKTLIRLTALIVIAGTLAAFLATARTRDAGPIALSVTETSLGPVDPGIIDDSRTWFSVTASPGSRRVAYATRRGSKQCVIVNGVAGAEYDGIAQCTIKFSPDGSHLAYVAERYTIAGKIQLLVLDGAEQAEYTEIPFPGILFSPDGAHLVYFADIGGRRVAVVDGKPGGEYSDSDPYYMPAPVWSADSAHVAFAAVKGRKAVVVKDGTEGPEYDAIDGVALNCDGSRIAYVARRGTKKLVVSDGVESPLYDDAWPANLAFSPDGRRFAYSAKRAKKWFVVVDGVEQGECDFVRDLRFLPDSRRVCFKAERWIEHNTKHSSTLTSRLRMVIDGVPVGNEYGWIGDVAASEDASRVAWSAGEEETACAVVDGVAGKVYKAVDNVLLSADGKHVAFAADIEAGFMRLSHLLVVDGVERRMRGQPFWMVLGPEGRHAAYWGESVFSTRIGVDGVLTDARYICIGPSIVFDDPTAFHAVARRGREFLLVEVKITEK